MSNTRVIEIVICTQCARFDTKVLRCDKHNRRLVDEYFIPKWCTLDTKKEYLTKNRDNNE